MPLYDCKCIECDREFETFCKIADLDSLRCDCGGKAVTLITNARCQDWFKPHWNPNFDIEPIYVRSRNHMKQLCRQYNLTSRALGDCRNITEI